MHNSRGTFTQKQNLESRAKKGALHKVPLLKSSPDGRGEECTIPYLGYHREYTPTVIWRRLTGLEQECCECFVPGGLGAQVAAIERERLDSRDSERALAQRG